MVRVTVNDAIRYLMKVEGVSQMTMATRIGKDRSTDVSARLNNKNMTFDKAIEMLNVLGYEVTIQKRKQGKRPDGQIVVVSSESTVSSKSEFLAEFMKKEAKK